MKFTHRSRTMRILTCIAIGILIAAPGVRADERESHLVVRERGNDIFVAGGSPRVAQPVKGDLVAVGGELRIAAPVTGDVLAAGGTLRIEGAAGQDLYAAGGQVALDGSIARNARVAGGSVSVGPQARIAGNASLAGGRIEVLGGIGGYLQVAGGRVLIDGRVDGDVDAAAGELELGPRARIGGKLRYRGGEALKQDAAAQVQGGIERLEIPLHRKEGRSARRAAGRAAHGVWTLGLMAMAAVLVAALPGIFAPVAEAARTRFGWSLLVGFLALVAVPAAIVVLLVTVIGIPLALLALLGYFALLLLGYVAAGIALGDASLNRWLAARAAHKGWRALFAALGVLAIGLLALIPWLGGLIAFLALLAGMGALLLQLKPRAAKGAA
jgi:cytoskeletal protein CcmA (bactofilin family)